MTSAATEQTETGAERRCIVSGDVRPRGQLLRFVVGPDDSIVPDLAAELPGRGIWVTPSRPALEKAVQKRLFARAARSAVIVAPDLVDRVERLLVQRCMNLLGLARRAGLLSTGFERVQEALLAGGIGVLLCAADASANARSKLRLRAGPDNTTPELIDLFTRQELSLALGKENVVHAALRSSGLATRFLNESARVAGFRVPSAYSATLAEPKSADLQSAEREPTETPANLPTDLPTTSK